MSDVSIWNEIIKSMEKFISNNDIERWLRPLYISHVKNGSIVITAPNKFFKAWVEDNYIHHIEQILKEEIPLHDSDKKIEISIIVQPNTKKDISVKDSNPSINVAITPEDTTRLLIDSYKMPLDTSMTFENFVVGNSNRMAHAVCVAASKGFDKNNNPLYIYGDVGLGKTHLMQAIGNKLRTDYPKLNILYTTCESYVNEFVNSLRTQALDKFKIRYNSADVLLFDDVQMLGGGKDKTRDEFFNTFQLLFTNNKRIILTSNCVPNELPSDFEERLTSRFSSGMMVDITNPSIDEKEAILLKRIETMDIFVHKGVTRFLAENVKTTNVREMIGVLNTLVTFAQIDNNGDVTQEFAEKVLKAHLVKRDKVLSVNDIIDIVVTFFNLKYSDLVSNQRSNNLVYARSIAMFLIREKTQLSLSEIGALFKRNHSTVVNSINKITDAENNDPTTKGTLDEIRKKMKLHIG